MKKCRSCQAEIDLKATKCPNCKTDQRSWFKRHPILTTIFGLIGFFVSVGALSSNNQSGNSTIKDTNVEETSGETGSKETIVENRQDIPAEYKSALNKATSYANTLHMSKKGVYDQLISEYGEKFTPEAARYAVDNVKADWNANALAKAKNYQDQQSMSSAAIRTQLISLYGEKFTEAEADYAITHLND